jgi:hypothetical protein
MGGLLCKYIDSCVTYIHIYYISMSYHVMLYHNVYIYIYTYIHITPTTRKDKLVDFRITGRITTAQLLGHFLGVSVFAFHSPQVLYFFLLSIFPLSASKPFAGFVPPSSRVVFFPRIPLPIRHSSLVH